MKNSDIPTNSVAMKTSHGQAIFGEADADQLSREMRLARKAEALAGEIMRFSRNSLLMNLRFLESAFMKLVPRASSATSSLATDGRSLFYDIVHVCRSFKRSPQTPTRDFLHVTLHCLFRHLFVGPDVASEIWDLACDVAAENIIANLGIPSFRCDREAKQKFLCEALQKDVSRLSAEKICRWLKEENLPPEELRRLRGPFLVDEHSMWREKHEPAGNRPGSREAEEAGSGSDAGEPDGDGNESGCPPPDEDQGEQSLEEGAEEIRAGEEGLTGGSGENQRDGNVPALAPGRLEREWKEIAERVEIDLETFSRSWGESVGDMLQTIKEINEEKRDYAEFLRKFSVLGENMQVNDDEFDYIFYTYGLRLYGRMPLVEPLEHKEVKRIREFVIALDTSESVAGDLVQKFVAKTWNMLKQTENFFTKVNVHIIQCGARVEDDAKITCDDDFEEYMRRLVLKGFGGTDYRPLFEHVNNLIKRKEFVNFQGLIYFTDGYGDFPAMPPAYKTAFVFVDQGRDIPEAPLWAIKVKLTEKDIEYF
jgi:predicted metal-dependent peptidase